MVRTIHCTVVEVPAMSDPFLPRDGGFRDLVPWADPYIAALMENLRRAASEQQREADARNELPPPLDRDESENTWHVDWSPRNWPRR